MKHGSDYAKRIKRLYHDLLKKHGKPAPIDEVEPIDQMIIGILALDSSISKAQAVYKKLRQQTVDLNELRVTPAVELSHMIGDGVPLAGSKAQRIVDALNAVRRRQDALELGFLRQRGRREAREYLESLDGVGPTVAAHVVLFSLGGHGVPVDNLTLYVLRKEGLIDGDADLPTTQAFLERCISASEAAEFTQLMSRHVGAHAARLPLDKLPEMLKPAPPPAPPPPAKASPPVVPTSVKPSPGTAPAEVKSKPAGAKSPAKGASVAKAKPPHARPVKSKPAAVVHKKK